MSAERITVLMYHRVGRAQNAWERRYCVTPERFAQQLRRLGDRGYHACTIDELFGWLQEGIPLAGKPLLITFDDGYAGVHRHALPALRGLGWPATVFLVSGQIGGRDHWCASRNHGGTSYPLLDAEQIAEMSEAGFSFHSHSQSHVDLTKLPDPALAQELRLSKQGLEQMLGRPVPYFAYPYGRFDERVARMVKAAGYQGAFSTRSGFNRRGEDPFALRRIEVEGGDTPRQLLRKITFGSNEGSVGYMARYYWQRLGDRLKSVAR